MMKYYDFLRFGVILKPKNKTKYTRLYKKENEKENIGSEL